MAASQNSADLTSHPVIDITMEGGQILAEYERGDIRLAAVFPMCMDDREVEKEFIEAACSIDTAVDSYAYSEGSR